NSTNQKTIGINKLGTLLSSQTTGTTGTKHDQTIMSSLRSNFSSLPAPTPQPQIRSIPAGSDTRTAIREQKLYEDTGGSDILHMEHVPEPLHSVGGSVTLTGAT
ncbi:hypothetical protein, partial [Arthrobacter sp. SX1312]|uniref:hypothetical protein n=1 Tax=Arthrobacter sp. SX1312 TaxID=2058896 RepID=UPI001CA57918